MRKYGPFTNTIRPTFSRSSIMRSLKFLLMIFVYAGRLSRALCGAVFEWTAETVLESL